MAKAKQTDEVSRRLEVKHTPGPWTAQGPFNETVGAMQEPSFEVSSPDVSVAFVFCPRKDAEARETARLDAHLIAQAPAMYASLSNFRELAALQGDIPEWVAVWLANVKRILAAAEGRS